MLKNTRELHKSHKNGGAGAERDLMIFSGRFLTFTFVALLIPISSVCNCFILFQEMSVLLLVSMQERKREEKNKYSWYFYG